MSLITNPKTQEKTSDYYGKIFYREIGEISFLKKSHLIDTATWAEKFHPAKWFLGYMAVSKFDKLNKQLSFEEQAKLSKEDYQAYHSCTYFVLVEEDNKDWLATNKQMFINLPDTDVRKSFLKTKSFPAGCSEEHFISWFINSKMFISDRWLQENKDYVAQIEAVEKQWNDEFIQAVLHQDIKGIRTAYKRQVNIFMNNEFALTQAIIFKNNEMFKYFINKKFTVNENHLDIPTSDEIKDVIAKKVAILKKKNLKLR